MAGRWLAVKKLAALGEDLSSLPNNPTWDASQLLVTPISRDPVPLMWGHLHSYVHTYTETDRQIHTYKLKIKKKKSFKKRRRKITWKSFPF